MAAPKKEHLDYYNWSCKAYDTNFTLKKLSRKYGPLGETIYRRMLDLIYITNYYIVIDIDELSYDLAQKIGTKWCDENKCAEILRYCTDIGLFDKNLVECNVWTSDGIQKRYFEIMEKVLRRTIDFKNKKYLLIDVPLSVPKNDISSEETGFNSEKTRVYSEETGVNSDKGNEIKINQNKSNNSKEEDSKDLDASDLPTIIENIEVAVGRKLNEMERSLILNDINNKRDIDVARFFFTKHTHT
ncbi:DUF4373 domain-containing protein [Anaerorhabdus furcosa]|uniref:Lin1244/Lin1753-like N-terminal domain-containing protein n=1 Tax=Anaerorhabdus furcosa TaxID=118967 RepID=A0A1T4M0A2_9FIRM|nr:DUF4373 domain-containing protein [Anaerorhabdus furcosa]SJZ60154.1 protein of unknown function [Anaerorhabdus furcosa]